jgi:hypothetical protein
LSNTDPQELLRQIENLQRQMGTVAEPILPPRKSFSPADAPELAKFEQFPSPITSEAGKPPGNPWKFRAYPRCLYMAQRHPSNGKFVLSLERPEEWQFQSTDQWGRAMEQYRRFSESCLRTVETEREHESARAEGWRDSAAEAMEFRELEAKRISEETAERNYRDRNMSENALAEVAAVEAEHFGHLPEIPEAKKRGRPHKNAAA